MNKNILHGKWRQVRGGLKAEWARLTENDMRLLDGKIDQMVGLFEERYGYTQERAAKAVERYIGDYGITKGQRAGRAKSWLPMISTAGFFTILALAWFFRPQPLAKRQEFIQKEPKSQGEFVDPEIWHG